MADSGANYTGVSSHSSFASNDPTFDSYDALRDCVTRRTRSVERPKTAYPRRRSSEVRPPSPPMIPTPLSHEDYEDNIQHAEEKDTIHVQDVDSEPETERDEDVPPPMGSHSRQSSSREENPQFVDRTESPPLQDLPFVDRHPVVESRQEYAVEPTVSGPGVGNFGVAIKGEVASFHVTCRLMNGDPWEWEPTSTAESLPVLVEVDDITDVPSTFVEPVWIQYSGKGVFKASYKVPKDATKLDIRVYLHGEQIGEDKYTVYPTIALPVEIARVIGSGVATVDALFSPSAQKATKLRQPRDVAISSDGAFLCVTDVDNQQVLVYSGIDNRLLKRLGDSVHMDGDMSDHTDTKPVAGRLHHPWGVAISHNCEHVAVTDSFHHCIQVFNVADGSVYKLIGSGRGSSPGALNRPAGLVFDKRGNVFVCDSSNHRIQMFSERGKALRCFGDGEGPLEGQLRYPLGIDISSDDSTLYVCDSKNHRIAVFDVLTGECVRTFGQPHLSQPISISLSSDDSSVFVRDNDCDRVIVFSPDGKRLCVLGQTDENSPDNFPGRLSQGAGMTVTPLGHLYAVDKSSATVVVLRAPLQVDDGQSTHSRASAGAQSIITTVSGLLGRDSVVANLSSSSHRRSHKTSRRSDSTSTLTGNPSSQHRLSLPDSTVVSVRATQSPPVQRREPMKPDSPRGRTSSIREFAARLDSECDFDEPPLVQPRQMESSRRKERTQRSPEPRHEVFEKLSDDDDYRRRSERRKPESERVPSRKHRSKSPEDRHAVSISSSTRTPSTESINTKEIEKRVFKAVEDGVSGLVETATESVRVEFEAAIQQMEMRIMESMKRLVSQAVRGAVESVLAAHVKPPQTAAQPLRAPLPVPYPRDRPQHATYVHATRPSRPLARHVSGNSRDVSSSRSPSPQVMRTTRSNAKLARHRHRSSSKSRRKELRRQRSSGRDDLNSDSDF